MFSHSLLLSKHVHSSMSSHSHLPPSRLRLSEGASRLQTHACLLKQDNPRPYSALPLNYSHEEVTQGGDCGLTVRDHKVYSNKSPSVILIQMTETLSSGLNLSLLTYFLSFPFLSVQITRSFTPLETTRSINIAAAEPGVLIRVSSTVFQHLLMCVCQPTQR